MLTSLRFFWWASKGQRLAPWRSPYVRWRVETYSGLPAESVTLRRVLALLWRERVQFARFVRWVSEMSRFAAVGERCHPKLVFRQFVHC